MDDKSRRRKRQLAEFAAVAAFFAVLLSAPWLMHVASLVILRLDPGAVPETFFVVYRTVGDRYAVAGGSSYTAAKAEQGIKTFRLPESGGRFMYGKGYISFTVLEDDGSRQVVEVDYDGLDHTVSRYAAYADRIVPVSYRGLVWGYGQATYLPAVMIALALGMLAAWGTFAGAARLTRLQQT